MLSWLSQFKISDRHFRHFKNKNFTGAVNAERKYLVDINQKVVKHQKLTSLDIVW